MPRCPHCHAESRTLAGACPRCGRPLSGGVRVIVGDPRPATLRLLASDQASDSGPSSRPARGVPSNELASSQPGKAATPAAPIAHLVYHGRGGSDSGPNVIILAGQDVTIGRAPGCDVTLADDPLASRRHSMLRHDGQHYTVKDLGSSNGTYVNDVEIHEVTALNSGDRIIVGEHEFAYMDADVPLAGQGLAGADRERFNTDGYEVRTPPSWPPSAASRPSASTPPSPASRPSAPLSSSFSASSSALSSPGDPMARDIEELRTRLMEVSTALAQRTGSAEEVARRLREIMGELRERVERALAIPGATAPDGALDVAPAKVEELIQSAQATVENPRHLDVVTALAAQAGDIGKTLDSQRRYIAALESTRTGLVVALREIQGRLAGLLDDEPAHDEEHAADPPAS